MSHARARGRAPFWKSRTPRSANRSGSPRGRALPARRSMSLGRCGPVPPAAQRSHGSPPPGEAGAAPPCCSASPPASRARRGGVNSCPRCRRAPSCASGTSRGRRTTRCKRGASAAQLLRLAAAARAVCCIMKARRRRRARSLPLGLFSAAPVAASWQAAVLPPAWIALSPSAAAPLHPSRQAPAPRARLHRDLQQRRSCCRRRSCC